MEEECGNITEHRLYQIVLESHGGSWRENTEIANHFKLSESKLLEDVLSYTSEDMEKDPALAELMMRCKLVEQFCDTDHLIGRRLSWMNNPLFCMSMSHQWYQCNSVVRQDAEDWCFFLCKKQYFTEDRGHIRGPGVIVVVSTSYVFVEQWPIVPFFTSKIMSLLEIW